MPLVPPSSRSAPQSGFAIGVPRTRGAPGILFACCDGVARLQAIAGCRRAGAAGASRVAVESAAVPFRVMARRSCLGFRPPREGVRDGVPVGEAGVPPRAARLGSVGCRSMSEASERSGAAADDVPALHRRAHALAKIAEATARQIARACRRNVRARGRRVDAGKRLAARTRCVHPRAVGFKGPSRWARRAVGGRHATRLSPSAVPGMQADLIRAAGPTARYPDRRR